MAQTIKLKRTAVQGKIPLTSNLDLGELAINTYDGRIFFEKDVDGTLSIQEILTTNSQTSGSFNLTGAISASSLNISGNTTIDGDLTLGGQLTIGDSTTDSVNIVASLSSSLIPENSSSFDIGSTTYNWRRIYAGSSILLDDNAGQNYTLTVGANSTGDRFHVTTDNTANKGIILSSRSPNNTSDTKLSFSGSAFEFNNDIVTSGDFSATDITSTNFTINDTLTAPTITGSLLRLSENGSGLRMTNVGAFDNSSGNFRIFSTNDLILSTNGDSGTAVTFDSSTKEATFVGNITASNLSISGNATIDGNLTLGGNITIGDSTTDSISVSADFSSSLIPDSGSTYDLGSSSKPWNEVHAKNIYGDGSNITGITVDQSATISSTFTNQSSVTVSHNFNTRNILVAVYDNGNNQVLPQNVNTSNLDQVVITLSSAQSGVVVVAKGGHILSGSADDSTKLGGKLPSAYATTGSNQFQDNQEITGSLNVSGGITGSISATNGIISGSSQVVSSLLNQDVNLGTGDLTGSNLNITSTGSFGRVEATSIDLDRLSLTSTQTTVPPLQLTANSLQDGVGALRIDGSQADIFLNPSTATHTTVTFAVNNDQRLAFGMDNNSDFYITRRTGGNWYDDTLVLDRDTGQVSLGYDLSVSGDATIVGNLTVQGTTTTINTSTFNVEDNIIELNYGGSATEGGIFVKDSTGGSTTSGSLLWDATNDYWKAGTSGSESEIITTSNIVTNLPTGTISGSEQLPIGTVSGSTQITDGSGLLSSSNENFTTFSSSVDNRLDQLEVDSGSQDSRLDNLESFTSSLSNTESTYSGSFSGSYVGDGSGITGLQVDQVATITASFSDQSTINVSHNFDTYNVIVSTYDSSYNQLIPQTVSLTDTNTVQVVLSANHSGHVVVAKGGHVVSGSTDAGNISGLSEEIQTLTSYREDVSGASFYNVTHSLDESYPFVQAWNTSNNTQEQPLDIESVSSNVITVSFSSNFTGKIIVKK